MNDIKNDKNLCEAVCRKEQKLSPMPADLNERLQQRLSSLSSEETKNQSAFSSLSSWRGRGVRLLLLAVAASIALLIVFNFGKQQSSQEPVVAQTNEMVSPLQPPHEGEAPPLWEGAGGEAEQSEERSVKELSEDAPQATDPTSTGNVEAPHHFTPRPVLDITSPKDEPFFLASTSYMVAPRSYRDGLAVESAESENGSAIQLPTKTVSQNRPQVPSVKENFHKLTKKERKQLFVVGAIAAKRWHIDISSMSTMRYGARTVTPDFYLELRGDTLRSYLPYLGQAQVSMMSPSIGLNFEEPVLSYKESKPKSNKYTQIDIDVKTREDSYHYVIDVFDSGQACIRVRSMNRDPISFDGTMEIE